MCIAYILRNVGGSLSLAWSWPIAGHSEQNVISQMSTFHQQFYKYLKYPVWGLETKQPIIPSKNWHAVK
jgi:hypothetical protein